MSNFLAWLDEWWRQTWDGQGGGGGGSVGAYAWSVGMSQYGYIGWYLGAVGSTQSDMADLQHPFSGYGRQHRGSPAARNNHPSMDDPIGYDGGTYDFTFGLDDGSTGTRTRLVDDPDLVADNSSTAPLERWWAPYQPEKSGGPRGEIGLDTGPDRPPVSAPDWGTPVPGVRRPKQNDYSPHGGSSYRPADDWMPPGQGRPHHGTGSANPPVPTPASDSPPAQSPGMPPSSAGADIPDPPSPALPPSGPSPDAPPAMSSSGITLPEVTVYGKIPFEPAVSVPGAVDRANRVGRIEFSDLVGFAKGAWNGVFKASQELQRLVYERGSGPILDPIVTPLLEPFIKRSDEHLMSIGSDEATGALIGEQISENLVFEAMPFLPQMGQAARRALRNSRVADLLIAPVFWFTGAGGIGSRGGRYAALLRAREVASAPAFRFVGWTPVQSQAAWARYQAGVGSPFEAVFEITERSGSR